MNVRQPATESEYESGGMRPGENHRYGGRGLLTTTELQALPCVRRNPTIPALFAVKLQILKCGIDIPEKDRERGNDNGLRVRWLEKSGSMEGEKLSQQITSPDTIPHSTCNPTEKMTKDIAGRPLDFML